MISACAALSPSTSSLRFPPFLPSLENVSLSYQPPHSVIIPSSRPPLPSFRSSSLSPLPSIVFPVFLLVCPSLVCVSLSLLSTFPLFLFGGFGFFSRFAPSLIKQLCLYRFLPFFLSLVGQFHPLSIRAAHCSRVSRIAEVKPSDDFLAGTWFRALLFSSLPPCLFPLSAFIVEAVVTVDRSEGTRSVDRNETTERGRTTSEVTDVTVNGGGANKGVTGVASN